jgi:ketosteroid isomerase-like protein
MSQENVELVRRGIQHWNDSGEFDWAGLDDEVEWVVDPDAWLADTYRGREGIRLMLARLAEAFDGFRIEVDRYVDAGDAVVTLGRTRVRGGRSGVTTGQPLAFVFRIRAGRIVAVRSYLQPQAALEAVGLSE